MKMAAFRVVALGSLGLVAGSGITLAQTSIHQLTGSAGDELGWAVAGVGDIDRDGFDDVVAGAPLESEAVVYSGKTGAVLYQFLGQRGESLGYAVAGAGDVNGDRVPDVVVGAPDATWGGMAQAGRIEVFSGLDGSTLYNIGGDQASDRLGVAVAGIGDLDGDGCDEFAAGAPQVGLGAGEVLLFEGCTGRELHRWFGNFRDDAFGQSLNGAGDVNADGTLDVIIGAPDTSGGGLLSGTTYVFSGSDYQVIHVVQGVAQARMGWAVDGIGDVNQDGFDDFLSSAPQQTVNGVDAGAVHLLSGKSAKTLAVLAGDESGQWFGDSAAGVDDMNGDGTPDVAVGISNDLTTMGYTGSLQVWSGNGTRRLYTHVGAFSSEFGRAIAGAGDVDGNGFADLIVGAPQDSTDRGTALVLGGADLVLDVDPGYVFLGIPMTVTLQGAPNKFFSLFIKEVDGMPTNLAVWRGTFSPTGQATLSYTVPIDQDLRLKFVAFALDASNNVELSNFEDLTFLKIN